MTDADDAGLVELLTLYGGGAWIHSEKLADLIMVAKNRLEAQRREIEELRRERDIANEAWKGTRCAELREQARAEKAEAALAEALKVIEPFAKVDPRWIPSEAFSAASAFAAKHGGRE